VRGYSPPVLANGVAVIDGVTVSIPGIRLESLLGSGANGFVFAGFDEMLDRRIAVKVWPPRRNQRREAKATEQALREARKLANVNSKYVVPVYSAGHLYNDWVYLTMALFEGETLHASFDSELIMRMMLWSSIVKGLDEAEAVGVYHGDLHEGNILVSGFEVAIIDFGTSAISGRPHSMKRHAEMVHKLAKKLLPELEGYITCPDIPRLVPPEYATRATGLWVSTASSLWSLDAEGIDVSSLDFVTRARSLAHCIAPMVDLSDSVRSWLAHKRASQDSISDFSKAVREEKERQEALPMSKAWFGIFSDRPTAPPG
jgi:serine/threonine protein kinase